MFSTDPFCDGDRGSQNPTVMPVALSVAAKGTNSERWSQVTDYTRNVSPTHNTQASLTYYFLTTSSVPNLSTPGSV
ncbi:hypothetical protein [Acetobacter sp. DsW_063]|uniref:hypothetical protein n=1 Tax=Acetobacter sp. DsW_063 TaxID=1514894 RepID=UPI000A3806E0|nr:hypothetical protein [Acetobacter sp. DsW_063]OUJ13793.1 hypothetical protein HK28_01255 [Acetobacter sp. DsW_063]